MTTPSTLARERRHSGTATTTLAPGMACSPLTSIFRLGIEAHARTAHLLARSSLGTHIGSPGRTIVDGPVEAWWVQHAFQLAGRERRPAKAGGRSIADGLSCDDRARIGGLGDPAREVHAVPVPVATALMSLPVGDTGSNRRETVEGPGCRDQVDDRFEQVFETLARRFSAARAAPSCADRTRSSSTSATVRRNGSAMTAESTRDIAARSSPSTSPTSNGAAGTDALSSAARRRTAASSS